MQTQEKMETVVIANPQGFNPQGFCTPFFHQPLENADIDIASMERNLSERQKIQQTKRKRERDFDDFTLDLSMSSSGDGSGDFGFESPKIEGEKPTKHFKTEMMSFSSGEKLDLSKIPIHYDSDSGKKTEYRQRNSVYSLNVKSRLDLKHIAENVKGATYNPQKFPAVTIRICDPKATALIFSSGKINICGSKSAHNARLAAEKFIKIISDLGFDISFENSDLEASNMVFTYDLKKGVRLREFASRFPKESTFETEIFPGLIFRMEEDEKYDQPKMCFTLFSNGKFNMTGAKSKADMEKGLKIFKEMVKPFLK